MGRKAFRPKNAHATYQCAMNTIFHKLIDTIVEVYIDDVVLKYKQSAPEGPSAHLYSHVPV